MLSVLVGAAVAAQAPNLAADTRPLGDERKFFVFHQQGVSIEQARRDLSFCLQYAQTGAGLALPYFLPWDSRPGTGTPVEYSGGNYGLMGAAIGSMIGGPLERSKRQMSVMRCMLPRGYARYRISEGLWKEINGPDLKKSIEIQALIASGPTPQTPKALP